MPRHSFVVLRGLIPHEAMNNNNGNNKERRDAILRILLSTVIIVFFVCVVFVYYRMLDTKTQESIVNSGRVNAIEQADQIDRHMSASLDILKLAGYTVDNMIKMNRSQEEILDYLENETTAVGDSLIANTTGIYGYIRGEYMDGSGWVPDDDYDPTVRPWYVEAMAGGGEIIIVDPYVDLDTGTVMIALAYTLSDGKSVVGIDISMDELQKLTEEHVKQDRSYAEFIFNNTGMIVAHSDSRLVGKMLGDGSDYMTDNIGRRLSALKDNYFYLEHDGKDYMIYVMPLENDWTCVSVIDATDEFEKLRAPLIVTVLITLIFVAASIVLFVIFERKTREVSRSSDASKRAQAANEANMAFLADISNEIKTPINSMIRMNEKILAGEKDEDILSYSEGIKREGNTLLELIDDVRDYSEIKSGKVEIVSSEYDISELIDEITESIRPTADIKGVTFSVKAEKEIPRILSGDRERIGQIIRIILRNAVSVSDKGNVDLYVSTTSLASTQDHVIMNISVSCDGVITEEAGLGVGNAKSLLGLMDSTLHIDSETGKGSAVTFGIEQKVAGSETLGDHDKVFRPALDNRIDPRKEIYEKIKEAAKAMDCAALDEAVSKLEDYTDDLSDKIRDASDKYDYDEVVRLLGEN